MSRCSDRATEETYEVQARYLLACDGGRAVGPQLGVEMQATWNAEHGMPMARGAARVVLTDHPWEDLDIERRIIEGAGLALVTGQVAAPSAAEVEALVAAADPQAILTCWAPVSAAAIGRPQALRIVARLGVGIDNIDVAAASARGAWVTDVPDYGLSEVSDHSDGALQDLRRCACEEVVRVLAGEPPRQPRNTPSVLLPGGVSSDIRVVQGPDGELVVKTALGRLKVAAEWLSDPARSGNEVQAIRAAADLLGQDAVPEIVWWRPEQHSFAMRRVDRRFRNWKQDLLAGQVDPATARAAGVLLGRLHRRSMAQPALARRFSDTTYFRELRVRPFFDSVAARRADLAPVLHATVLAMQRRAGALVHGDYSPKNILADGADLVILDFEVAHWGDPRFDLAFCLSHLLLKAHRRGADRAALARAAALLLDGYAAEDGPAPDDRDLVLLVGCLAMARLEGVSPVDYIEELDVPAMGATAAAMMLDPAPSVRRSWAAAAEVA